MGTVCNVVIQKFKNFVDFTLNHWFYSILHREAEKKEPVFLLCASFYCAMLCIRGTSDGPVSMSVCLCLCPSQVGVLL